MSKNRYPITSRRIMARRMAVGIAMIMAMVVAAGVLGGWGL